MVNFFNLSGSTFLDPSHSYHMTSHEYSLSQISLHWVEMEMGSGKMHDSPQPAPFGGLFDHGFLRFRVVWIGRLGPGLGLGFGCTT